MLTLSHVTAAGRKEDVAVPVPIVNPRSGRQEATVWVRVATQEELYALARKCRRHEVNPGNRQVQQTVDGVKVQQLAMKEFIDHWDGVCDVNGDPLPCIPVVFNALPEWMADQITDGIRGVPLAQNEIDADEVSAASFREPA